MTYLERIKALADRIPELEGVLGTEEATKNALVMPFIAALGYDVFNPHEVIPEFNADVATKKGEKVDYAIRVDDRLVMLWECKRVTEELDVRHTGQLFRYFSVTKARIGVLTNGIVYQFFSDIEEPNKMDVKPFLEIDLRVPRENRLRELERLTKGSFDLETMLSTASDLKYMREVRRFLEKQFDEADESFVRVCFVEANPQGRFSKSAREQFGRIASRVLNQIVSDRVSDRLRKALEGESPSGPAMDTSGAEPQSGTVTATDESDGQRESDDGVITTEEEREGFLIVRAILRATCPASRVTIRDTKSYCGVLFDDNNRKPICRLHFNRSKRYLGVFDGQKKETRHLIESLEDIYQHAESISAVVHWYMKDEAKVLAEPDCA